ncbi:MAG: hypothetical protein HWQ38_18855 [Nostoc sp. NMS7]|uniref:hypothetical protein n=1 Tax=Nostoc sp. NMS7 TaxID=2815391 RepID=UPI0025D220DA|nr:hypothetical protein [Nostoc sp. NMS7]MBN3948396.1 hypothetical protein [Nostoc sp. NMS7]
MKPNFVRSTILPILILFATPFGIVKLFQTGMMVLGFVFLAFWGFIVYLFIEYVVEKIEDDLKF